MFISTTALGAIFCLFGSVVDNLGITIQKWTHLKYPQAKQYWHVRWWWFGLFLFLFGNIWNGVGLSFAPESVFAALGSISVVANIINCRIFLKEEVSRGVLIGSAMIIASSVLSVMFGSTTTLSLTIDGINSSINPTTISFSTAVVTLLFILIAGIKLVEKRIDAHHSTTPHHTLSSTSATTPITTSNTSNTSKSSSPPAPATFSSATFSSPSTTAIASSPLPSATLLAHSPSKAASRTNSLGAVPAWATIDTSPWSPTTVDISVLVEAQGHSHHNQAHKKYATELTSPLLEHPPVVVGTSGYHKFLALALPTVAGIMASITATLSKSSSELIRSSIADKSQFIYWQTYLILFFTICSGLIQINWMNLALKKLPQIVVVPIFFVVFTILAILAGIIVFEEYKTFRVVDWIVFPLSVALGICGIYVISFEQHAQMSKQNHSNYLDQPVHHQYGTVQ
eukprot:TRINITY_DN1841_c0_g3_i1.p1 TRINITY_DN1841_c0_g3~~TRINITY_DN1841_c0_g3_i1.p1  ORF type:complete len:455 (+),score=74.59 TRINITY_DN1841_c0_g3_i1:121-1485(+)